MKKCPFCGGSAEIRYLEKPKTGRRVVCVVCTAQGPVKFSDEAASAGWNCRDNEEKKEKL